MEAQIELEDSEPGELTNYLCHERRIMLLLVHACSCSSDVTRDKYSIRSATSIGPGMLHVKILLIIPYSAEAVHKA